MAIAASATICAGLAPNRAANGAGSGGLIVATEDTGVDDIARGACGKPLAALRLASTRLA
jgi:hypothetical protein